MKLTMLLADAAQAVGGKLYILGGGWSITGPDPTPSAIAIKIEVPWTETNMRHSFQLRLLDEDGQPVAVPTPIGNRQMEIGGEFEVGRPAGLRPGTPIDVAIALNIGPLPLRPGARYEWRCLIDNRSEEDWRVAFSTRTAEPQARPQGELPT